MQAVRKMKVLLADKREIFREGLANILGGKPDFEVVATCSSGLECIQKATALEPDVVILDTEISECDCIEAIQCINGLLPAVRILILTHSEKERDLFSTLKAGATAYISKDACVKDLIETISRVHLGEVVITPPMAAKLINEFALWEESKEVEQQKCDTNLTEREAEVLSLVAKGATNKEIGSALFIAVNTVKVHLSRILEKLQVRNRQQAAVLAIEKGIVSKVSRPDT